MSKFMTILFYITILLSTTFSEYIYFSKVPRYASRGNRNDFINQQQFYSPTPMGYSMDGGMINSPHPLNHINPTLSMSNKQNTMNEGNIYGGAFNYPGNNVQFDSQTPYQKEIIPNGMGYQKMGDSDGDFNQRMIDQPMYIDKNEKLDIVFPKFLEDVDQEVVNNFLKIISLKNETYARKQQKLDQLVSTLDDPHQLLYKEYVLKKDGEEKNYRSKVDSHVGTMSQEAQEKFNQITSILMDPQTPDTLKWDRVMVIYNSLSPQLKEEFEKKFEGFKA